MIESEVKEEIAEEINNKCGGNKDWCGLKKRFLDVLSEVCGYTKDKPRHFETWWWNKNVDVAVCRKRESYLEFGIRVRMRKIRRNIVRQKNMRRKYYILLWIRKLKRQQRRLICIAAVVSCLELPHKGLGRRKMLLRLVVLKMKEHMDNLMTYG